MSMINSTGFYRGRIVDHGIGTIGDMELPQWNANLLAVEKYDADLDDWVDWAPYEECEMPAYLCLFSKKGDETLNHTQLQKAIGWDGCDLCELAEMDLSDTIVLFEVRENRYTPEGGEERITLRVDWIDKWDATPGRSVKKLDPDALKELQAKFGSKKKAKPASAATAKTAPVAPGTKPAAPTAPAPRAPGEVRKVTKPAAPVTQPTPPAPANQVAKDPVSKEEAWETCASMKRADVTDAMLAKAWTKHVNKIAGKGTSDADITDVQWREIQDAVLDVVFTKSPS